MIKRLLSSVLTLALVLGSVATLLGGSSAAQAATTNTYIKGSSPTVYWYASNGKRYVFPNGRTFQSWQTASSPAVTTIGDVELYTIAIGGNMTYRPGSRLVKITTDPKVYAVSRYGVLRWVTTETVAQAIYGQNWAQMVDDLPDEFFANYTIGAPINNGGDYNASTEFNAVGNPGDNISAQASIGNGSTQNNQVAFTNMYVGLTANRETVMANDTNRDVTITATVTNPSIPVDQLRIRIYDRNLGGTTTDLLLRTCDGVVTCVQTVTLPLQTATYSRQYLADISNRLTGQSLAYNPNLFLQSQGSGTVVVPTPTPAITVLPYGPYTCAPGYVWREAIPDDYACVTGDVRAQGWADNAQAMARVSPTGGAYGPDTCIQGYVWREARPEDHVCVTPAMRDQAHYDNAQASARRASLAAPNATNPAGSIRLTLDRSTVNSTLSDRTAVFSATVSNLQSFPTDQVRIRFVNESTETVERTCDSVLNCTFTYTAALNAPAMTTTYRAELFNRATNVMVATPSRQTLTIINGGFVPAPTNRFSANTSLQGSITQRWITTSGETVEYHADLLNPPTNLSSVMIRVYDVQSGQQLWKDCPAVTQCAFTLTSLPRITRSIIARATDAGGTVISSNTITVVYGTQDQTTQIFQVTGVSSALDTSQPNRCNEGFGVIGTITANGPGTVSYKWERSDGALPPTQTVTFTQAGTKTVTGSWFLSGTYSGWLQLHVIAPNEMSSTQTAIVSQCVATPAPTTLSGSIYTSTDPGEARAGSMVRVDANLSLQNSNGPVRVEIYNQDGQGIKTCWNMSTSGFCQAYQAMIPANAQGTYKFYSQAIDSSGAVLRSNWFPVRIQ